MTAAGAVELVSDPRALARVAERCAGAPVIAVDVEADGLFAYRPKLCTVQLAWPEDGTLIIAVVDTLRVEVTALAPVFAESGPVKVLHDLTFDARLLEERGAPLGHIRDTSVAARLLGFTATGLAALAEAELGLTLGKRLQQHDWSRRPLRPEELAYLAGDVRHLLALDERLAARAEALGLTEEIADECAYKLSTASRPPRDTRPAYTRIKGVGELDAVGRAVLRRLVEARESIASAANVPPFKVLGNEQLCEIARKRPASVDALRSIRGALAGRAARYVTTWLGAVSAGVADGGIPASDRVHFERPRIDRVAATLRRSREGQLTAWRRAEALLRGVSEQAVLPGHCAQDLVDVMIAVPGPVDAAAPADATDFRARLEAIPGIGAARLTRYGDAFATLWATPPAPPRGDAARSPRAGELASEEAAGHVASPGVAVPDRGGPMPDGASAADEAGPADRAD